MSKLDQMRDLRGGVIYGAAMVPPTTARTWGLKLGKTRGVGHPRYDVSDAIALIIMSQLTAEMSIAAAPAAMIVNAVYPYLPEIIEKIVAEQEAEKSWRWEGGPYAIVARRPQVDHGAKVDSWLHLFFVDDIGVALADRRSGLSPIVIPFRRLINKGLLRLQGVLAGEVAVAADD